MEARVNIPASTFKHYVLSWFKCSLATDVRPASLAIQSSWAILDSHTRQQIIELCRRHGTNIRKDEMSHFLKWCYENRDAVEVDCYDD